MTSKHESRSRHAARKKSKPSPAASTTSESRSRFQGWMAAQPRWMAASRALGVGLLSLLHVVLLVWLAGSQLAPHIVSRYLAKEASQALNREIRLESLRVNPFTLEIAATGLAVMDREGGGTLAGFSRLEVNIGPSTLLGKRLTVQRFLLENPKLRLSRDSTGRLDIADLLPQAKGVSELPAGSPAQPRTFELLPPGTRFSLTDVRVVGGVVSFDDALTGTRQELRDLHFFIGALSSEQPGLHEIFSSGGLLNESSLTLAVKADLIGENPEAEARLSVKDVVFRHYTPYLLALKRPLDLTVGEVGVWTRLRFPARGQAAALPLVEGNAKITGVGLGGVGERVAGFDTLEVQGAGLDLESGAVRVERVILDAPHVRVSRDEAGVIDLIALLELSGEQEARDVRQGMAPDLQIGETILRGGRADLRDEGLDLALALQGLNARMTGLDLKSGRFGSFSLETGADRFTRFSLEAKGAFAPTDIAGSASMEGIDLSRPLPALKRLLPRMGLGGVASGKAAFTLAGEQGQLSPTVKADMEVRNLKALAEGQAEPLLAAASARLAGVEADFRARRLRVGQVSLSGGGASLARDDKGGFAALAAFGDQSPQGGAGKDEKKQGGQPASTPWTMSVGKSHLAGFALEYRDAASGGQVRVDLDDLSLGEFSPGQDKPLPFAATGSLNRQAPFDISGELRLKEPSLALKVAVSNLPLAELSRLAPQLPGEAAFLIPGMEGQAGVRGELKASLGKDGPAGTFAGDASLAGLKLVRPGQDAPWASLSGLALTGATVTLAPLEFKAASLALDQPFLSLTLDKDGRPVMPWSGGGASGQTLAASVAGSGGRRGEAPEAAPPPTPDPEAASRSGKAGSAPPYALDRLTVRGGRLELSAQGFTPPLGSQLSGVDMTLSDLRPGQPSKLSLAMTVGHSGKLNADGLVGWVSDAPMLDLRATLENMELGELSQISQQHTGFPITRGRLGLLLDYKATSKKLDLKNKIVVVGIQLGRKTALPGGKDVPLDLAVSLLSNAKGVIDLDIPVKGSFDQAKADLSDVISTAMAGAFAKILFSPLAFLNVAQGSGQTAMLAFAPGGAELTPQTQKTLSTLAAAIANRPRLSLEIMAYADPGVEAAALAAALAEKSQAGAASGKTASEEVSAGSQGKPAAKGGKAPDRTQPRSAPPVSGEAAQTTQARALAPADWAQLARQRQEAVRDYLVKQGKLSQERIFLITGDAMNPPKVQDQPGHRVEARLRY